MEQPFFHGKFSLLWKSLSFTFRDGNIKTNLVLAELGVSFICIWPLKYYTICIIAIDTSVYEKTYYGQIKWLTFQNVCPIDNVVV